ncbi:gamma-glutamylcyclotransferase [Aestuariivirga litoralis]|uniref:glutathione-specific gamma-glutamylcyclotransferase n=1 Tax=Aestuariivirga litoralis TaxID=2650924 RepID=A0A2W2APQ5_9HYPH|nr:gamma-glutamylcyclotransferase [Aestuariivirga litoralis]PZF77391.1 gamma-glutamylcyclotransferase [Aestuariivirga litoralis]
MKQFWIFGYGSLMWRPGFAFERSAPARIHGYHRSLCVYSHVHRGTPEQPGLVLGLDRGGSCHGLAFEVAPERWSETIAYLRAREQVTSVYLEKVTTARLTTSGQTVEAVTYVVDRSHRQYAGILDEQALEHHVRMGEGVSGHCIDYVANTLAHLREMNIHDPALERLAGRLGSQAASRSS